MDLTAEKLLETRTCTLCSSEYAIREGDVAFYDQFEVPVPEHCFDCRLQRRMSFYNRRNLYRRKCDYSGKQIVSMFSPDKPFKVYERQIWNSDAWDPLDYGRGFDFSRPFFEQYQELMLNVPWQSLAILGTSGVNDEFTNDQARLKNCYLVFDGGDGENLYYSQTFMRCRDSIDCFSMLDLELCYECVGCDSCYNLKYSRHCKNCSDSWFLRDCIGCNHCFGCCNLHRKEYYVFNEPHTREEYEASLAGFQSGDYQIVQDMRVQTDELFLTLPTKAMHGIQNQDVLGDYVSHSKNAFYCFNSEGLEDCRYCTDNIAVSSKSCMEVHVWGEKLELAFNSAMVGGSVLNVMCSCFVGSGCSNVAYCAYCTRNSHDLFGCVGLRQKRYCIFNQEYSADEYEELRGRIVAHMRDTGEWGDFFPPEISPCAYNESLAPAHFPLSKAEVLARGWQWSDYEAEVKAAHSVAATDLPASIDDVGDDILETAITCERSGRLYKIIRQELEFYRLHQLPLPRLHPDERHLERLKYRNPYRLWDRTCAKCGTGMLTAYPPDSADIVYCEECYMGEVY
ncbi:hypothetical protein OAO01_05455 [Oligoflexia bacterium]|nr:hypothetical protein [Oligoflexia bacterium]